MNILANVILTAISSYVSNNEAINNRAVNENLEDSYVIEMEKESLKIIEEIQSENSIMLSDEEIIDLSLERIQIEIYNGSLSESQINDIKRDALGNINIINSSDIIIGDISPNMRLLELGNNEEDDNVIYSIMNFFAGYYYPSLRNFSPNYIYSNLPNPNSNNYLEEKNAFLEIVESSDIFFSQQESLISNLTSPSVMQSVASMMLVANQNYHYQIDFSYLDEYLQEFLLYIEANSSPLSNIDSFGDFLQLLLSSCPSIAIGDIYEFFCYETQFLSTLSQYETAVAFQYQLHLESINAKNIMEKAKTKDNEYYEDYYTTVINGEYIVDEDNNTLDAFRHTYLSALLYIEYGENCARELTEAREYNTIRNNPHYSTNSELRLSIDMDLLNNKAGRTIGEWWSRNGNIIINKHNQYPEIPTNNWDALAYYVLHCVSYGEVYDIYTFGSLLRIDGELYIDEDKSDSCFLDGSGNMTLSKFHRGLAFTNYGESEWYKKQFPNSTYTERPYFYYPPKC